MVCLTDYDTAFTPSDNSQKPALDAEKIVLKTVKTLNTSFGDGVFTHFIGSDGNEYVCFIVCCAQDAKSRKEN